MIWNLKTWRSRRLLIRHPILEPAWHYAMIHCGPARRLPPSEQVHLRTLATLFLRAKALEPVQGLVLSEAMRALLAAHACLPILNLGLEWYAGWHSVVVYPGVFIPERDHVDAAGVVHHNRRALTGESWQRGPVILSWDAVLHAGVPPGHNVAIHEFSHKLDMLHGGANGFPPLHADMDSIRWTRVFHDAYSTVRALHLSNAALPINAYALDNPAEFFAVASEAFFETPMILQAALPDVYNELRRFYRQNPGNT